MNDTEKFLFDLQGFIVVREFLSQGEVKALNDAFDANWDQRREDPIGDPSGNMISPSQFTTEGGTSSRHTTHSG